MANVEVRTRDGEIRSIEVPAGSSLMRALREAGAGVVGTCGGMCSCGSCHVYVLHGGQALKPPGEDEADMLDAMKDIVEVRPESRLSCQINGEAADSLIVEIAPQF